jgi:hypothetical protein
MITLDIITAFRSYEQQSVSTVHNDKSAPVRWDPALRPAPSPPTGSGLHSHATGAAGGTGSGASVDGGRRGSKGSLASDASFNIDVSVSWIIITPYTPIIQALFLPFLLGFRPWKHC